MRLRLLTLSLGLAAFGLASCQSTAPGTVSAPPSENPLSLEEKVGQLFVVPANGVFANEESDAFRALVRHVRDEHVGGVIFFRSGVHETHVLAGKLQQLARVPLLFSADLEAGTGQRFDDVMWGSPAMALAATGDPDLTERRAYVTAVEARAIGITQVYAPVADVNVNPDNPVINVRSFGEDPAEVSRFVAAYVRGLERGGVVSTVKHFPGHGDTATDSHRSLPVLRLDRARLNRVELPPFRAGIQAGTRSVMVAHLAVPALDQTPAPPLREAARNEVFTEDVKEVESAGTLPATLSPAMVNGLLRKEMGFDGLVVTDAMTMGGLVAHFDAPDAALRAIEAGVDQVLMSADTSASIRGVLAAVKSGRLPEKTIDAAVARILKVKRELGLYERRMPALEDVARVVGRKEHEALEYEVASRSLTLLRDGGDGGALPVPANGKVLGVIVVDDGQITPAALRGIGPGLTAGLTKRAKAGGGSAVVRRVDQRATGEDVARVLEDAKTADTIVVAFFVPPLSGAGKLALPPRARDLVRDLQATGKNVVAVSFGNPYLLRDFPDLPTYLCAYGIHDVIQRAVVAALYGETTISGRSPVTLPGLVKRGDGIEKKAVAAPLAAPLPAVPSRV